MNLPKYQLKSAEGLLSYEFISEGRHGLITKRIQFTPINYENIYNLGFGDKDVQTGEIDDTVVSNNGDSEKVLATVAGAVFAFLDHQPNAWIFAVGSTSARTRLYQIGISRYYNEIKNDLDIYGQLGDEWHSLSKNIVYEAFLVKFKTV